MISFFNPYLQLRSLRRCRTPGAWLALLLALCTMVSTAHAMQFEVRVPYVIMSGGVTGMELRQLESVLADNPGITTIILKDSHGGDASSGYEMGAYIREHGLNTAVSGYCISSCSRMFLGGKERRFSDEQALEKTFIGFHGNYTKDGFLQSARMPMLKDWIIKYSDGKANPALVEQWVHIANHHGYDAFYHRDAKLLPDTQKVLLCQGTEDRQKRQQQCEKPQMGDALDNGIVTTWDLLQIKGPAESTPDEQQNKSAT